MGRLRAVDTNVLVRYIVRDDPIQSPVADQIVAEPCFVSETVLLELAWVLRSNFGLNRATLASTLRDLIALSSVEMNDELLAVWAIERFAAGADFADMIHIIACRTADSFASFEDKLDKKAGPDSPIPIETLR